MNIVDKFMQTPIMHNALITMVSLMVVSFVTGPYPLPMATLSFFVVFGIFTAYDMGKAS